jgi:hypothetical protein
MKDPTSALFLSMFLPGVGLAYLGKWVWALVNLGVVLLIEIVATSVIPKGNVYILLVSLACSVPSALLAHAVATEMNGHSKSDTAV